MRDALAVLFGFLLFAVAVWAVIPLADSRSTLEQPCNPDATCDYPHLTCRSTIGGFRCLP